jgi:hypothetical protein
MRRIAAIPLFALVPLVAFAQLTQMEEPVPPQPVPAPAPAPVAEPPTFAQFDVNRDGLIAREEVPASHELSTLFASYDHDQDARLNRQEFAAYSAGDEEEEDAE